MRSGIGIGMTRFLKVKSNICVSFYLKILKLSLELLSNEFETACQKWGIKINTVKTKILSDSDSKIRFDGVDIENINSFSYLGSVIPSSADDIIRQTALLQPKPLGDFNQRFGSPITPLRKVLETSNSDQKFVLISRIEKPKKN